MEQTKDNFSEMERQLLRLGYEESSLPKRHEITLRMRRRGCDPKIVYELSQESLDDLEKRLARAEKDEQGHNEISPGLEADTTE